MFCQKCRAELPEESQFCIKCGARLNPKYDQPQSEKVSHGCLAGGYKSENLQNKEDGNTHSTGSLPPSATANEKKWRQLFTVFFTKKRNRILVGVSLFLALGVIIVLIKASSKNITASPTEITIAPPQEVTVLFDAGEGDVSSISVMEGKNIGSLPPDPIKKRYTFLGWFTEPYGMGYQIDTNTIVSNDMTVYADWTRRPDFLLANATGTTITQIEIKPSRKTYANDENVSVFKDIRLLDKQQFAVFLPESMWDIFYFDIAVKYKNGKDNAKTKERIHIVYEKDISLFVMHIKGKDPTIPLAGGGVAAGGIAGTAVALGSAAKIASALKVVGTVVGGGMAAGVGVVAAVPIVIGATIFAILPDTLIVTQISY
jgi:uncharacterized repeat protein (TIGR02543 family)